MSDLKSKLISSALLILFVLTTKGLPQSHIGFNHLTVENGLSQRSVTCIFQDSKGFMWFGTQDGLNRFDGYGFKVFKNDPGDSTSLSENFIFSIMENPSGDIYIETRDGSLHQFYARSESFRLVQRDKIDLTLCRISSVTAHLYESSGIIWAGGLGKETGLVRTNSGTGEITTYRHDPANPHSLSSDKVYSIFRDRTGNLWIGPIMVWTGLMKPAENLFTTVMIPKIQTVCRTTGYGPFIRIPEVICGSEPYAAVCVFSILIPTLFIISGKMKMILPALVIILSSQFMRTSQV